MSRHHPDLVMCRKQPGISIGRLCDKCDGKCPVCDSYVRPTTLVRICDECSFGNYQNKCIVCGGEGISDAFYCFELSGSSLWWNRLFRVLRSCPLLERYAKDSAVSGNSKR
ncbi:hypothetical protein AFLA70_3g008031 [Aspergillus flavus AF70]|nr:hypothetical protein AFLA70_3g008031 [Aspergillus flavus AF70]